MRARIIFILFFIFFLLFYYLYFIWYSLSYSPPAKNILIFSPGQPEKGPGGREYLTESVEVLEFKKEEGSILLFLPKDLNLENLPTVVVLSGFITGRQSDFSQAAGLMHLAKKGNIVLVPIYQQGWYELFDSAKLIERAYQSTKEGLLKIRELFPNNNFSNFAIIGFSLGGPLATHLLNTDLPRPKILIFIAPTEGLPLIPPHLYGIPFRDLKSLPYHSFLLGILAEKDRLASKSQMEKLFKTSFAKDKYIFKIPSDFYGNPPLLSNHNNLFFKLDAINFYGCFKLIDAALDCVFYSRYCSMAKGEDERTFLMGKWSDDRPIKQIIKIPIK